MKYITLISFALLVWLNSLLAQSPDERQVAVCDIQTKEPIPYATIRNTENKGGTYTNTNGLFILDKALKDSLYISSIGYLDKKICRSDIINDTIYLEPQVNELPPLIVSKRKIVKEETLGVIKAKKFDGWRSNGSGEEFAQNFFFPDTTKVYKIKTIIIGAGRFDPTIPIVIHIYNTGANGYPDKDILLKKIVLTKKDFKKSKKRFEIDISAENILINESSCFIGFEWLPMPIIGSRWWPSSSLLLTEEFTTGFTYVKALRSSTKDKKWGKIPVLIPSLSQTNNPTNTIMSIKVDVLE